MSHFLSRLAERAQNQVEVAQPLIPSYFAPPLWPATADWTTPTPYETEEATVPDDSTVAPIPEPHATSRTSTQPESSRDATDLPGRLEQDLPPAPETDERAQPAETKPSSTPIQHAVYSPVQRSDAHPPRGSDERLTPGAPASGRAPTRATPASEDEDSERATPDFSHRETIPTEVNQASGGEATRPTMPNNVEGPPPFRGTAESSADVEAAPAQRGGERSPGPHDRTSIVPDRPGQQDKPARRSSPISTAHSDNDPDEIATTIDRQGSGELPSSAPTRGVSHSPSPDAGVHRPGGSGARQYLEEEPVEVPADQEFRDPPLPQRISDERPTATDEDEPLPDGPRGRRAVRSRGRSVEARAMEGPWEQVPWPELIEGREVARQAPSEPTIRVTIGRVEVRAVQPPSPPEPRTSDGPRGPRFTLDDYREERSGGGS